MGLSHEYVGSKIFEKIKIYILTRAELLFTLCYEIPWSLYIVSKYSKRFRFAPSFDNKFNFFEVCPGHTVICNTRSASEVIFLEEIAYGRAPVPDNSRKVSEIRLCRKFSLL